MNDSMLKLLVHKVSVLERRLDVIEEALKITAGGLVLRRARTW